MVINENTKQAASKYRVVLTKRGGCSVYTSADALHDLMGYSQEDSMQLVKRIPVSIGEDLTLLQARFLTRALVEYGMGVSRHTFGRLLRRARRGVAQALVLGQALRIEGGVCALDSDAEPEPAAPGGMLVAVPSLTPGGPDAAPCGHFGRCQLYTLARVEDGKIAEISVQPNPMSRSRGRTAST